MRAALRLERREFVVQRYFPPPLQYGIDRGQHQGACEKYEERHESEVFDGNVIRCQRENEADYGAENPATHYVGNRHGQCEEAASDDEKRRESKRTEKVVRNQDEIVQHFVPLGRTSYQPASRAARSRW